MRRLYPVLAIALSANPLMAAAQSTASATAPAATAPLPSITLPKELDRVLRDYEAAWSRGDASALSKLFADDGFVMQSGRAPVRGRAAIQQAYTGSSGGALKLRALAASVSDSIGYIVGAYAYGDNPTDVGKFTLTLKRVKSGPWLIFSDMDNASRSMR